MVSSIKCLGITTVGSFLLTTGATFICGKKFNKNIMNNLEVKNGNVTFEVLENDGSKLERSVPADEFKKTLDKQTAITSAITGGIVSSGVGLLTTAVLLIKKLLKK